jgi:hypothetical protein
MPNSARSLDLRSSEASPIGLCRNVIARDSRGGGRTEAISQCTLNKEIAASPSAPRNDKTGLWHSLYGMGLMTK